MNADEDFFAARSDAVAALMSMLHINGGYRNLCRGATSASASLTIHPGGPPTTTKHSTHSFQSNHSSHSMAPHLPPGNAVNISPFQKPSSLDAMYAMYISAFLYEVEEEFRDQPQVYYDFLNLLKEFKSKSIELPVVIQSVSNLFRGHPLLIVSFNNFLEPGDRIEVPPNEQVQVSKPGTNLGRGATSDPPLIPMYVPPTTTVHSNKPGTNLSQGATSCHDLITMYLVEPPTTTIHSTHCSQSDHSSHSTSPHSSPGKAVNKELYNCKGAAVGRMAFGGTTQQGNLFGATSAASSSGFSFGNNIIRHQRIPLFSTSTTGTTNAFGSGSISGQSAQTQNEIIQSVKQVAFDPITTANSVFNSGGTSNIGIRRPLFNQSNQQMPGLFGAKPSGFGTTDTTTTNSFGNTYMYEDYHYTGDYRVPMEQHALPQMMMEQQLPLQLDSEGSLFGPWSFPEYRCFDPKLAAPAFCTSTALGTQAPAFDLNEIGTDYDSEENEIDTDYDSEENEIDTDFLEQEKKRLEQENERLEQENERLKQEIEGLKQKIERLKQKIERAEQEIESAEQEKERSEQEKERVEQEKESAEQGKERVEQDKGRAEQEKERAEQEKERAEQELATLDTKYYELEKKYQDIQLECNEVTELRRLNRQLQEKLLEVTRKEDDRETSIWMYPRISVGSAFVIVIFVLIVTLYLM